MTIKVRALERGYIGGRIRNEGDEFTIDNEEQFSAVWMEALDGPRTRAAKPADTSRSDPEPAEYVGEDTRAEVTPEDIQDLHDGMIDEAGDENITAGGKLKKAYVEEKLERPVSQGAYFQYTKS